MEYVDRVGTDIYRRAGEDPEHPPAAGAVDIAAAIYGGEVIQASHRAMEEAATASVWERPAIVLRPGTPPRRAHFLVGQQVARLWLADEPQFRSLTYGEQDAISRQVGAWLVAPPLAMAAAMRTLGDDIPRLANRFRLTQTCVAIRLGELIEPGSVVATQSTIYRRGSFLRGFADESMRTLAAHPHPRSLRRVELGDEPGRVALLPLLRAA